MPTRRMIDPRLWQSETLAKLTLGQRLLFIGLFSNADDQGRLRAHPALIRSLVFPYDDTPLDQLETDLQAIADAECIQLYETEGRRCLQVINWWHYQKPQWAYPSQIPSPEGWQDKLRYRQDKQILQENWPERVTKPSPKSLSKALAKALPEGEFKDKAKDLAGAIGLEVGLAVSSSSSEDPIASASADANNPAPADKTPVTFAQWLEYLEPSKNRQALVRRMIEIFYPGHDPPDYGYIVKVAKKLGRGINGYRRLMELLWRQHTDPPKGDILPYIMAIAKKDSATARHLHDHKGDPPPPLPPIEDDRTEEDKRLDDIWKQAEGALAVALGVTAVNTYLHDSYLIEQTPERAVIVVHDELSSWLETDGWQRQIRQALGMNPDATIAFEVETEAE